MEAWVLYGQWKTRCNDVVSYSKNLQYGCIFDGFWTTTMSKLKHIKHFSSHKSFQWNFTQDYIFCFPVTSMGLAPIVTDRQRYRQTNRRWSLLYRYTCTCILQYGYPYSFLPLAGPLFNRLFSNFYTDSEGGVIKIDKTAPREGI